MSNTIGWGKGSENNDIGWGQGAVNNNIGWGAIHELSYSGETNIVGGLADERFIMVVKSDNAGTSGTNQFTIPTTGTGYLYDVETSDGYTATGITGSHTITFPSGAGTHTVFITGNFPRIFFANLGDKLKVLEVTNWGTYGITQADQSSAFFGCSNLSQIADNGTWFDVVTNGNAMFTDNSLTSLPAGMTMPLLTNGAFMFRNSSLTSLPSGMTLPALQTANDMFLNNSLTSLPAGMELPLLTNGQGMFINNSLTSLPSGMTLPLLSNGTLMFRNNSLTSLPAGMTLPALTNAAVMFRDNALTSLPSGMNLPLLLDGGAMFFNNSLTDLPAGMTLPLLIDGQVMFVGCTINTTRYSQLLIDLESGNANNGVAFHGGSSKYNASGQIARDILTGATRLWTITDGGLEL